MDRREVEKRAIEDFGVKKISDNEYLVPECTVITGGTDIELILDECYKTRAKDVLNSEVINRVRNLAVKPDGTILISLNKKLWLGIPELLYSLSEYLNGTIKGKMVAEGEYRRKIKEALIRYNSFSDEKKQLLPTYVSKYCPTLFDEETQKFKINSEKELTELLNGMNQRYYTTEIDEEKRLANSVTVVEN